jgi:FKBP-type peptidyl-prolyl cis-trans isomerase
MKFPLILTMATALIGLSACGDTPEEIAAKEAALQVCPPSEILADISTYSNEMAAADLPQAEWFAANGIRDGVKTTESGLQYSVNKSGNAKGPMPESTQKVRVNYHGQFLDGATFDSSYDRGKDIEFPLNGVIKGWTEGVGLMRPCDAWTFYIPSDLAYGANGRGSIPPATPLVFHVQLIEVTD